MSSPPTWGGMAAPEVPGSAACPGFFGACPVFLAAEPVLGGPLT